MAPAISPGVLASSSRRGRCRPTTRDAGYRLAGCQPRWPPRSPPAVVRTQTDNGIGLQVLINQGNGTLVDETAARLGPSTARLTGRGTIHPSRGFQRRWIEGFLPRHIRHEDGSIYPRIWLNNGNNTLDSRCPECAAPGIRLRDLLAVDFDGDGRPDILQLGGAPGEPPRTSATVHS